MWQVRVMEKLRLPTNSHTKSYKLQFISEEGEIMVNKQVLITFAIGKYKHEVWCDVVPMEATRVLLENPCMVVIPTKFLSPSKGTRLY